MNEKMRRFALFSGLSLCVGLFVSAPRAESTDSITLEMAAHKEITVTDETGAKRVELVEPKVVVPGDEVIYTITYTNVGRESATSIVVTNHIPEQMTYVRDTAGGANASVLFSTDGSEFAARNALRVRTPEGGLRPAEDRDLTHIRWVVSADVPPGKKGTVAYRARLQ